MKTKLVAYIGAFCADLSLSLFLYLNATNYREYLEVSGKKIESTHFQIQLYQLLLQSLTFTLFIFLIAQALIYTLAFKEKSYSEKSLRYLKFFSFFGMTLSTLVAAFYSIYFIILAGIYFFSFQNFKKNLAQ